MLINGQTPTVRLYDRERGGKRNFYPAPRNPDLAGCYWLCYEKDGSALGMRADVQRRNDSPCRALDRDSYGTQAQLQLLIHNRVSISPNQLENLS